MTWVAISFSNQTTRRSECRFIHSSWESWLLTANRLGGFLFAVSMNATYHLKICIKPKIIHQIALKFAKLFLSLETFSVGEEGNRREKNKTKQNLNHSNYTIGHKNSQSKIRWYTHVIIFRFENHN